MLQHFKGWRIQAAPNTFNDAVATLMDFKTEQDEGTTFFTCFLFHIAKLW